MSMRCENRCKQCLLTKIHESDRQKRCKKCNRGEHYGSDYWRAPPHFNILYVNHGIGGRNDVSEKRLLHDGLCRKYFLHRRFKMLLPNSLRRVWTRFGRSGGCRLQHSVLYVASAHVISLGKLLEINVGSERRLPWVYLQLPDLHTVFRPRHLK